MKDVADKVFADIAEKNTDRVAATQQAIHKAQNILRDAIMNGDSMAWMRSKLMLVGEGRAGKTSTLRSLLGQVFNENQQSTIGADMADCIIDNFNVTLDQDETGKPWQEVTAEHGDDEFDRAVAQLVKKVSRNVGQKKQRLPTKK